MPLALPHPPLREQLGMLRRGSYDPSPVLDELAGRFGPIIGLGGGPARIAIIGDPTALREMFALPAASFRWGHKFNVLGFVVGEGSMIVSDGDDHRRRRSSVQSAFSRRTLNGWIPTIVEQTDAAIDQLLDRESGDESLTDLYAFGRQLVLRIVVNVLFGERLVGRANEIGALFQRPQDYLESSAIRQIPHPFPGTARAKVRSDRQALDALLDEEIRWVRSHPADDPANVLEQLVAEGGLSDSEIRDQVVSLIGAGYDTTSASLAWMVWCVSITPNLWHRLRSEADHVLGPVTIGDTHDQAVFAGLTLANATMRETTRLHPAGVISPREAVTDLELGGYHIAKGTLVLWSAHIAGRSPEAWDRPLEFDPDRFLHLTSDQEQLARISWVPFGRGSRNCIGFALAQMELTLIISRLAQRLDIKTNAIETPPPIGMVVNRPTGGAPMHVSARPSATGTT